MRGEAGGAGPDGLHGGGERGFGVGLVERGEDGVGALVGEAGGDGGLGVAFGFAGKFGVE